MVPRPIFRGTRLCNCFIPLLCCLEITIYIYNYSTIVEKPMVNQLTNGEFNTSNTCYSSHAFHTVVRLIGLPTFRITGR